MDNVKIGKRIEEARTMRCVTLDDVASLVGVAKSTIQRYERGKIQNIKIPVIHSIAKALDVNPSWIIGKSDDITPPVKPAGKRIPVLGSVVAGIPIDAIEEVLDWEEIPADWQGEYFALKIKGDSMEPKISDGDVVIVKKQEDVECGDTAVVLINAEEATVKQVVKSKDGITLVATNTAVFMPKFFSNREIKSLPVEIVGKVVELRAKF